MSTKFSFAARLVGKRLGVAGSMRTILLGAGQPRLFSVSALVGSSERYMGVECDQETGAAGYTEAHASAAAIGELVERYSCGYCNPDALRFASQQELGDEARGMDVFQIHSEEEYARPGWPFRPQDPAAKINWAEGRSLVSGKRCYVPAALVYIPYTPLDRSDFLTLSVSSGNAAHTDPDLALLSGLFEVVERDAFMIAWWRKLQLPRVDYMQDPHLAAMYARYYEGCNATFHVFDMTFDFGIPTYLCLCEFQQPAGRAVVMGAATRYSPRAAIDKAMLEAAQCLVWGRDLVRRKPEFDPGPDWKNIREFEDRVRLFCEPNMRSHLSFWLDSPSTAPLRPEPPERTAAETLHHCIGQVSNVGLETIVVDQTSPDIRNAGFVAPKVMIPGIVPLTAVHRIPMTGSPRIREIPGRVGLGEGAYDGLNPIPHLFP